MNYGDILKYLREENELTQKEVAEKLKIKRSTYNQYEQQYDIIPSIRLCQVADLFNVSIDYILGLTTTKKHPESKKGADIELSKNRLRTLRKNNKLSQASLASFLGVNQTVIAHYETGRNLIATPSLYFICKKYKISADYLLGRIENIIIYNK